MPYCCWLIVALVRWSFCSSTGLVIRSMAGSKGAVLSSQHWRCSKLSTARAASLFARPKRAVRSLDGQCGGVAHRTRRTDRNLSYFPQHRAKPTSAAMLKSLPLLAASVLVPRTRACILCRAKKVTAPPRPGCGPPPRAAAAAGVAAAVAAAPAYAVADAPGGDAPLIAAALAFFVAVLVDAGGDPVDPEREPDLANFGGEPEFAYVLLRGYKRAISPNLPKNCRFVPTCSEYTALAIKEFGFAKGFVLFIWRLMRCNPAGGKGYDSPAWPPVGFKAGDALPAPRGRMPSLVEEDVD